MYGTIGSMNPAVVDMICERCLEAVCAMPAGSVTIETFSSCTIRYKIDSTMSLSRFRRLLREEGSQRIALAVW